MIEPTPRQQELDAVCYALEALRAAVDVHDIAINSTWASQARERNMMAASNFIAAHDALTAARAQQTSRPTPYDRDRLIDTLTDHQADHIGCSCGLLATQLTTGGWPNHVADEYEKSHR